MQDLKELIDSFIRKTQANMNTAIYTEMKERLQYFDELFSIRNKIFMQLNYKGYLDDKIMTKINDVFLRIEIIYEIDTLFKIKDTNEKIKYLIKHYHKDIIQKFLELVDITPENRRDMINSIINKTELPKELTEIIGNQIILFNEKFTTAPRKISSEIQNLHNELIMYVQIYLKLEWDRVKNESISKLKSVKEKKYKKVADKMINNYKLKLFDYQFEKLPDYLR